jgi:hypothetical protein
MCLVPQCPRRFRFGLNTARHAGLSWPRFLCMHAVMRSTSGTNSLQRRITSGVQSSAALEGWANAGVGLASCNRPSVRKAAAIVGEFFIHVPLCVTTNANWWRPRKAGHASRASAELHGRLVPHPSQTRGTPGKYYLIAC